VEILFLGKYNLWKYIHLEEIAQGMIACILVFCKKKEFLRFIIITIIIIIINGKEVGKGSEFFPLQGHVM
jgi:hypothetical protein